MIDKTSFITIQGNKASADQNDDPRYLAASPVFFSR